MSSPRADTDVLALVEQHRKILFKIAAAYADSEADRQDLVQETVVQLWRAYPRFDRRARFSTWMYRVALNVALSHARERQRRSRRTVAIDEAVLERVAAPPAHDAALAEVHALLAGLPELDRALVLLHLEGHAHDEVGEILGISASNVGTRLGRIKQKLRQGDDHGSR